MDRHNKMTALRAIYGAARTPEDWKKALGAVRAYLEADAVTVVGFDAGNEVTLALADSLSAQFDRDFAERSGPVHAMIEPSKRCAHDAHVVDICAPRDKEDECEGYCRWLRQWGLAYCLEGILADDAYGDLFVAVYWADAKGLVDRSVRRRFKAIRPHLECAFQISRRLAKTEAYHDAAWSLINRSPHGVIAVDVDMKVVHTNEEARRILDERDGIEMRGQKLLAEKPSTNATLRSMIEQAANPESRETGAGNSSFVIRRSSNRLPVVVMALPVNPLRVEMACGTPAAFLFIQDLGRELEISITAFSAAFVRTPAERRHERGDGALAFEKRVREDALPQPDAAAQSGPQGVHAPYFALLVLITPHI
jgi:hypothetical protein